MLKNKKLFYGILVVVIAIVGIGLFVYLSKPTITPLPKGKIMVKQSGGAGILMAECADKNYISNTADYIIEGTVEKVESKWNEEKTSIFTYSDFRIERYVKGTPFVENKLQIVTPGGTVEEIGQWVEDQPIFHEGKKVRIYFQEMNGEFSIVCAQMGVEDISGYVSWEEAIRILNSGQVTEVGQTHSLEVTLILKNGKRITTKEPAIDDIFEEVKKCGDLCKDILMATE